MNREFFRVAAENVKHNKLRSWLTLIGIAIGISAVIALTSLGNGLEEAVQSEFNQLGTNRILITPGGAFFGPLGGSFSTAKLLEDDLNTIRSVAGVKASGGVTVITTSVKFKNDLKSANFFMHATDRETLEAIDDANLFDVEIGRELKKSDTYEVVIGWAVANELFERQIKKGELLEVNGQQLEVVGIQKKIGSPPHDNGIRINEEQGKTLLNPATGFTLIIAISADSTDTAALGDRIAKELRKTRDVDEGEEDFAVQTPQDLLNTVFSIFNTIQSIVIGLAGISLLVGGVGIMNTMYTAVLQRTREIGVLKAIGAKNSSITQIFLTESAALGLLGGAVGVAIGFGIAKTVSFFATRAVGSELFQAQLSPSLAIGAMAFSALIGAISGTLPAIQASKLKPTEALRYE